MILKKSLIYLFSFSLLCLTFVLVTQVAVAQTPTFSPDLQIQTQGEGGLGFNPPTLGQILTFVIRAFFVIAGLAALFYMLLGAFAWVTSGGDADAVSAAQQKIQAAVVGMLIIVGVLAIIWTLEQVIFGGAICIGLSCPLTLPSLIQKN